MRVCYSEGCYLLESAMRVHNNQGSNCLSRAALSSSSALLLLFEEEEKEEEEEEEEEEVCALFDCLCCCTNDDDEEEEDLCCCLDHSRIGVRINSQTHCATLICTDDSGSLARG